MNTHSKVSESRRRTQDRFNKTALALGLSLALGASTSVTHAAKQVGVCNTVTNNGNNFTMLTGKGAIVGGTNDVAFTWDGSMFDASSDYTGPALPANLINATISSPTLFSSYPWTAHDVQVFAPGTYTFNTALGGGNAESGSRSMTVGANQIGMHMLFDWNGNNNIDVLLVLGKNATFGSGRDTINDAAACGNPLAQIAGTNCLWAGGALFGTNPAPTGNHIWMLGSVDTTYDDSIEPSGYTNIPGTPMATGGPFGGFNANFNFNGTLLPANGTCGPAQDQQPDPYTFAAQSNAPLNTTLVADAMFTPPGGSPSTALSGLGVNPPGTGITAPISISGDGNPEYSLDGNTWFSSTDPAGAVQNGDTVKIRATSGSALGSTVTATLNIGNITASFVISTSPAGKVVGSNFTMNTSGNGIQGGANDVVVGGWNFSTPNNTTSTGIGTGNIFAMTLSSNTLFSSNYWTAHDIRVFNPGSYTFNTGCTGAELRANGGANCAINGPSLSMVVGQNQLGGHMLFDWNGTNNIDVAMVWDKTKKFGPSPMFTGFCGNSNTVWDLAAADQDGDGHNGIPMLAGDSPFPGFYANFNISLGPVASVAGDCKPPSIEAADTNVSKGAGCSLSTIPVNPLERGDWWVLLSFLGWMGFRAKGKRA